MCVLKTILFLSKKNIWLLICCVERLEDDFWTNALFSGVDFNGVKNEKHYKFN